MFGAIELPPDSSPRLVEKAGREGFRETRAYRDFRAILENFLVQLAADYFRDEAVRGTQYRNRPRLSSIGKPGRANGKPSNRERDVGRSRVRFANAGP